MNDNKFIASKSLLPACVSFLSLSVFNSVACDAAIYATQISNGSVSIINKGFYTKKFDVSIVNLSDGEMDLSSRTLIASSPAGDIFKLDTVEESLVSGKLGSMKMAKGFAVFSSEDDSVYLATMVKFDKVCKE